MTMASRSPGLIVNRNIRPRRARSHRFNRIMNQIEDDLLQLASIAVNSRHVRCQLGLGDDAMIRELAAHRTQHVENDLVDVDRLPCLINSSEQGADAVERVAGAQTVRGDIFQDILDFVKVG